MYISGIWGAKPPGQIKPKIFLEEGIRDVITRFKFGDDRFRGLASAEGQILPFPVDFDGRPYNTLTLPCERVITTYDIWVQARHTLPEATSKLRSRPLSGKNFVRLLGIPHTKPRTKSQVSSSSSFVDMFDLRHIQG